MKFWCYVSVVSCYPSPGVIVAIIVEIRAAEGGDDAKLLVREQITIYSKLALRRGL